MKYSTTATLILECFWFWTHAYSVLRNVSMFFTLITYRIRFRNWCEIMLASTDSNNTKVWKRDMCASIGRRTSELIIHINMLKNSTHVFRPLSKAFEKAGNGEYKITVNKRRMSSSRCGRKKNAGSEEELLIFSRPIWPNKTRGFM